MNNFDNEDQKSLYFIDNNDFICDFSQNDLNQLLMKSYDDDHAQSNVQMSSNNIHSMQTSPDKISSHSSPADKYNLMTKLEDCEENVDFMQIYNQFNMQKQQMAQAQNAAQVQYYEPQQNEMQSDEAHGGQSFQNIGPDQEAYQIGGQPQANMQPNGLDGQQEMYKASDMQEQGKYVNGVQQKMHGNEAMMSHGGMVGEQVSAHAAIKQKGQRTKQGWMGQDLTQTSPPQHIDSQYQANQFSKQLRTRQSEHAIANSFFQQPMSAPSRRHPISRKKSRPQSAAKNLMQPSKTLATVTTFTYEKAMQNLNQKNYVPDSLKNTDKERLYEEKINLKKQINELTTENQQLRTQVQSQLGAIRKKDEVVAQVMKQMFNHPTLRGQGSSGDSFLQEFQNREIFHKNFVGHAAAAMLSGSPSSKGKVSVKSMKNQSALASKDSLLTSLRHKIKGLNEVLQSKEKELQDLKQTLKFTKIKEYETELALNVQESQRLRALLDREMNRPKYDQRFVQALQQNNAQYQQIVLNLQQNQRVLQENYEKLNKKLIVQIKKLTKGKELRKKLAEKNQRLEKKLQILNYKLKVGTPCGNTSQQKLKHAREPSTQELSQQNQVWKQRFDEQVQLIEKLLIKMQQCGINITDEEFLEMQMPSDYDEMQNNNLQGSSNQEMEMDMDEMNEEQEQNQDQDEQNAGDTNEDKGFVDLVVTFAPSVQGKNPVQPIIKQMADVRFDNLDHLKETFRKEFDIEDQEEFLLKFLNDDGSLMELSDANWEILKDLGSTTQIQLVVELPNQEQEEMEPSNYDEDEFEEKEKTLLEPISLDQVKLHFEEMRLIMQIKKIKKGDCLKYILHGQRDSETNKKIKTVTLETFQRQLKEKIGFSEATSEKIARFLMEKPNDDGKVEQLDNAEFRGQPHAQAVKMRRKDLQVALLEQLKDYTLYNGLAMTSMLSRLQTLFEDYTSDLLQELEDQDYDEAGTAPMIDIIKSMKLVGLFPDSLDEELHDFLHFLAMRPSKSLEEVNYKAFMKVFHEDYSFIEDKSIWENVNKDGDPLPPYEPSSDEGELESERSPIKFDDQNEQEGAVESPEDDQLMQESANIESLEQNELLEKVDEILMQIVKKLPPTQKIKTLTHLMLPYLSPVFDEDQQRQYLTISQNSFIQFLLGQDQNQLGLKLDETHIICLLHLLVQEDESDPNMDPDHEESQDQSSKYILYDEFIELVKTYMKKELIMQQSKGLGIYYDILCKDSVEFLFQIRSSLMLESNNNINENSDEEEGGFYHDGRTSKGQKSVPAHIREIFNKIIQKKNIILTKDVGKNKKNTPIEIMDFDEMLDTVFRRLGIRCPSQRSQEELKFLMCLDFKYLETIMLIKFDKIMHDLDYISIDLLRQAQDPNLEVLRKGTLDKLKKQRESQLSNLKLLQAKRSANGQDDQYRKRVAATEVSAPGMSGANLGKYSVSQTTVNARNGDQEFIGVSHSTKQEKERKRPDDKKKKINKKTNNNKLSQQSDIDRAHDFEAIGRDNKRSDTEGEVPGLANSSSIGGKPLFSGKHISNFGQDSGSNMAMKKGSINGKERYGSKNNMDGNNRYKLASDDEIDNDVSEMEIDVDPQSKRSQQIDEIEDGYDIPQDDFDNIDVDLETDINFKNKQKGGGQQINESDFEEEYLQDDIPIDEDDDEVEDNIISDNYENYDSKKSSQSRPQQISPTEQLGIRGEIKDKLQPPQLSFTPQNHSKKDQIPDNLLANQSQSEQEADMDDQVADDEESGDLNDNYEDSVPDDFVKDDPSEPTYEEVEDVEDDEYLDDEIKDSIPNSMPKTDRDDVKDMSSEINKNESDPHYKSNSKMSSSGKLQQSGMIPSISDRAQPQVAIEESAKVNMLDDSVPKKTDGLRDSYEDKMESEGDDEQFGGPQSDEDEAEKASSADYNENQISLDTNKKKVIIGNELNNLYDQAILDNRTPSLDIEGRRPPIDSINQDVEAKDEADADSNEIKQPFNFRQYENASSIQQMKTNEIADISQGIYEKELESIQNVKSNPVIGNSNKSIRDSYQGISQKSQSKKQTVPDFDDVYDNAFDDSPAGHQSAQKSSQPSIRSSVKSKKSVASLASKLQRKSNNSGVSQSVKINKKMDSLKSSIKSLKPSQIDKISNVESSYKSDLKSVKRSVASLKESIGRKSSKKSSAYGEYSEQKSSQKSFAKKDSEYSDQIEESVKDEIVRDKFSEKRSEPRKASGLGMQFEGSVQQMNEQSYIDDIEDDEFEDQMEDLTVPAADQFGGKKVTQQSQKEASILDDYEDDLNQIMDEVPADDDDIIEDVMKNKDDSQKKRGSSRISSHQSQPSREPKMSRKPSSRISSIASNYTGQQVIANSQSKSNLHMGKDQIITDQWENKKTENFGTALNNTNNQQPQSDYSEDNYEF